MLSERRDTPGVWRMVLRSNWFVLPLLLLLWPTGYYVERDGGLDPYVANVVMRIGIAITLAVSLQLINGISGQFSLGHAGFMAVGAYFSAYPTTALAPEYDKPGVVLLFFVSCAVVALLAGAVLFALVSVVRGSKRFHATLPGLLFIALIAWVVTDVARVRDVEVVGWSTVWPKAFSVLSGVFGWLTENGQRPATWVNQVLPGTWLKPVSMLVTLTGAGLCAAGAGVVVGLPTLRLRGDYLAIATLGFAEIIRVMFNNLEPFGQARGLSIPFYANLADPDSGTPAHYILPWVYGVAIVTTLCVWRLKNSPKGRAIRAVRDDEIAASAIGIDPTHHKVISFVIGAFFAGVAGGLYAHFVAFINPDTFNFMRSVEIVVMVTLGGLGSIPGAVTAAIVLTFLPEFLRGPADWIALAAKPFGVESAAQLHLPAWVTTSFAWVGERRLVLYALMLIVVMLVRAKVSRSASRRG